MKTRKKTQNFQGKMQILTQKVRSAEDGPVGMHGGGGLSTLSGAEGCRFFSPRRVSGTGQRTRSPLKGSRLLVCIMRF